VDASRFVHNAADPSLRDELQLPSDAYLVATIGQICLRKAQDMFAKAAALVGPRVPKAHFLLIGERYSEKTESALYDEGLNFEFAMAGLKHRFHRLGYRSDIERLLPQLDLVVHCARQEPFGRVLLEAAAAGAPIITTRVGGTEEMLVDGESAVLVSPDEPQQLADEIVRLSNDITGCQQLGAAARAQVVSRFSLEQSARGLAEVWRHAL